MISDNIIEQIVDLIPSSSLKEAIKNTHHKLNDEELLHIAYQYIFSFDKRYKVLYLIASQTEDKKVKEWCANISEYLQALNKNFKTYREDAMYVLEIKENGHETIFSYFKTFEEAKAKFFDISPSSQNITYENYISKVLIDSNKENYSLNNKISELVYNDSFEEDIIYDYELEKMDFIDKECYDKIIDPFTSYNRYPHFFNDGALVGYFDYDTDVEYSYGLVKYDTENYYKLPDSESIAYIIPIDNYYVINNKLDEIDEDYNCYKAFECHRFVKFEELDVLDESKQLPKVRDNYKKLHDFYMKEKDNI